MLKLININEANCYYMYANGIWMFDSKAKIHQAFQDFDEDGLGFVTNDRARQILSELLGFSEEKSEKTVETFDRNKDGNIDYEEFIDFYSMIEQE